MRWTVHENPALVQRTGFVYEPGRDEPKTVRLPHVYKDVTLLAPGAVSPIAWELAEYAVTIAQRIAPWCRIIVAPMLFSHPRKEIGNGGEITSFASYDGRFWHPLSGQYRHDDGAREPTIILPIGGTSPVLAAAVHEAWHGIEKRLSRAWTDLIDADLPPPAWGVGSSYWNSPEERRCRMFEAFCAPMFENKGAIPTDTAEEIFAMAWKGELAAMLTADAGKPEKVPAPARKFPLFRWRIPQ